jgi:Asp-tRNA(Asn)/Glu-tRNA(Gln) amidotransferase A subunit family amidase
MASSAYDCGLILQEIAGHDTSDRSSLRVEIPNYTELLNGDVNGLRIGVDRRGGPSADPTIDAAFDGAMATLAELGADVFEVVLPGMTS